MLRLVCYMLLLLPLTAFAQRVEMENGEVLCDGKLFCYYTINGEKIKTLPFAASEFGEKLNPETTGKPFRDYTFRNLLDIPFAYVTAKVLSSPYSMYLFYYYKVEFPDADISFNAPYHPYFLEFFGRDMTHYRVLEDGKVNKERIHALTKFWLNKPNAIDDERFVNSSSCNYNSSPYNIENPKYYNASYMVVRNNGIYINDTLYANYRLSKGLIASVLPGNSKADFYYYIETPGGKNIVEFQVKKQHSAIYFWPAGYKSYLQLYTAVRDEKRLVWEVLNCVLSQKEPSQPSANNK